MANLPWAMKSAYKAKLDNLIRQANPNTQLGSGVRSIASLVSQTSVKARNDTGANLPRGAVIDLGDYFLTESDLDPDALWFKGIAQAGSGRRYAVAREPIPTNELGECQVAGVCIARVNVTNLAHNYAVPTASQNYFTSAPIGPVEILRLTTPESTGTQECVVLLRVPVLTVRGVTADSLTRTTAGTVNLIERQSGGIYYQMDGSDNPLSIEAYAASLNDDETIAANTFVYVNYFEDGYFEAISGNCEVRNWEAANEPE